MFAELLWVEPDQLVAGGNSSLTMMHDVVVDLLLHGGVDSPRPWAQEEKVTVICPVPGYDRHFAMLASHGIDMVTVPMTEDGPDAEAAARIAAADPSVKGMWVVPTYANPTGAVCSQAVASRLASMETAAPDFKIFWDNAYAFHHLTEEEAKSADILTLAAASGHPHRPMMFASTSKITYAGAGVAFLGGSRETVAWYLGHLAMASIGPDKVNQLRHAQFFGSADGVREHMLRHRAIIAPKFAAVEDALSAALGGREVALMDPPAGRLLRQPRRPRRHGLAGRRARQGRRDRPHPGGCVVPVRQDPRDRNIRLAPTFPGLAEVEAAMAGVATCVLLASAETLTAAAQPDRSVQ